MQADNSFTNEGLFFTDDSNVEKYTPVKPEHMTRVHWGQWKLILADIEFLTMFWNPQDVPNPIFVSVGAAPGQHYPILMKMFPQFRFVLYDPRPFSFKVESLGDMADRVDIRNQLFTDEDTKEWQGRKDVFFTSDIRSVNVEDLMEQGFSKQDASKRLMDAVQDDMIMQGNWVELVDPVFAMLKFRLPYVDTDPLTGKILDVHVEYLDGYMMKQQWAPHSSTEVRLIPVKKPDGTYAKKLWSSEKHQDKLFYFNQFQRELFQYKNVFTDEPKPYSDELLNTYDDTATIVILKMYLEKFSGEETTSEQVVALYKVITADINSHRRNVVSLKQLRQSSTRSTVKKVAATSGGAPGAKKPPSKVRRAGGSVSTTGARPSTARARPVVATKRQGSTVPK